MTPDSKIKTKFNALPWHDAVIRDIYIDRTNAGKQDQIAFKIEWPNDLISEIVFTDCFALNADVNFGVGPQENILDADCLEQSSDIEKVRMKWSKLGVVIEPLFCFMMHTNTSNSIFRIVAKDFMERQTHL